MGTRGDFMRPPSTPPTLHVQSFPSLCGITSSTFTAERTIPSPVLHVVLLNHQLLREVGNGLMSSRQFALEGILSADYCAQPFAGAPHPPFSFLKATSTPASGAPAASASTDNTFAASLTCCADL